MPRLEKLRQVNDLSVAQLTLRELHQELLRRANDLLGQKKELEERIVEIDRELAALGPLGPDGEPLGGAEAGTNGSTAVRRRPKNAAPLKHLLEQLLREKAMSTREAADAVLELGYQTTSKNFNNNVATALHGDERFARVDGRWTMLAAASPAVEIEVTSA